MAETRGFEFCMLACQTKRRVRHDKLTTIRCGDGHMTNF